MESLTRPPQHPALTLPLLYNSGSATAQPVIDNENLQKTKKTTSPHTGILTWVWEAAALWTVPQQSHATNHGHLASEAGGGKESNFPSGFESQRTPLFPLSHTHRNTKLPHTIFLSHVLAIPAILVCIQLDTACFIFHFRCINTVAHILSNKPFIQTPNYPTVFPTRSASSDTVRTLSHFSFAFLLFQTAQAFPPTVFMCTWLPKHFHHSATICQSRWNYKKEHKGYNGRNRIWIKISSKTFNSHWAQL